jgi:WD40 repeat protein
MAMAEFRYDVFLSHATTDKPLVEELARRLARENLKPWLDTWNLIPGTPWQPAVEVALADCAACAVVIGAEDFGPWQHEEMRAAIARRVEEGRIEAGTTARPFRVIPLLLPMAKRPERSKLPAFLVAATWVEFRDSLDDPVAFHRLVCGIRGEEPGPAPGESPFEGRCPYRGLELFDVEHAPLFFGREALTEWLLDALKRKPSGSDNRFLAVVGASGSGKSSLARARLMAALKEGKLDGSASWSRAICRPGSDPFLSLATTVKDAALETDRALVFDRIHDRTDGEQSLHVASTLALGEPTRADRLVVLVDQFEEVFTLGIDEARRRDFIANLLYAATVAGGRTVIVLAMRADFYPRCATHADLAAALSDHQVLVGPMTDDELRRAIECPARRAGLEPEPGLVELLLDDVRSQPGALPLLQFTLRALWERREAHRLTVRAYRGLGGLGGALHKRADAVYDEFSDEEKLLCQRVFLRLVQPGEGVEDTKRRVPYRELLPQDADLARTVGRIVDRLTEPETRLLTVEGGDSAAAGSSVEVAHEALIRNWPRLRQWVEADRSDIRFLHRLTAAAREWADKGRPRDDFLESGARLALAREWARSHRHDLNALEREFLAVSLRAERGMKLDRLTAARLLAETERKRREEAERGKREQQASATRLRGSVCVLAVVTLVAVSLGAAAWWQAQKARSEAARADARRLAAQSVSVLERHPQLALLLAAEAVQATRRRREPAIAAAEIALREALARTAGVGLAGRGARVIALEADMTGRLVAGGEDGTVRIWDPKRQLAEPVVFPGDGEEVVALAALPGDRLAAGYGDGVVRVWDPDRRRAGPTVLRGHVGPVLTLEPIPGGRLVSGGVDGAVRVWDPAHPDRASVALREGGSPVRVIKVTGEGCLAAGTGGEVLVLDLARLAVAPTRLWGNGGPVVALAWLSGGRLASGADDGVVRVWEPQHPDAAPVVWQAGRLPVLAALPDGRLAVGDGAGGLRVWDARRPNVAPNGGTPETPVPIGTISVLPGGLICAGGEDGLVLVWNPDQPDPPDQFRGHEGPVLATAVMPDGRLATGGNDGMVRILEVARTDAEPALLRNPGGEVVALAMLPGGRLAAGGGDGAVRVWDLARPGTPSATLRGHGGPANPLAALPGGRLAAGGGDGAVRVWDLARPGGEVLVLKPERVRAQALVVTTAGGLAAGGFDGAVRVWDLARLDAEPVLLPGDGAPVVALAALSGGRLAAGGQDGTARIWDSAHPGVAPVLLRGGPGEVVALAALPGGRLAAGGGDAVWAWDSARPGAAPNFLVQGGGPVAVLAATTGGGLVGAAVDGLIRVWRTARADERPTLFRGGGGPIQVVRVGLGNRLFAVYADGTVWVWDLTVPAAEPVILRGGTQQVLAMEVTDDDRLVTAGMDGVIRVWEFDLDRLLERAARRAGRNLGRDEWQRYFPGELYHKTFEDLAAAPERAETAQETPATHVDAR